MGDIIILVMVASPCQVSGNEQLKSFIVTVTVPHSPLEHSTQIDSGRVAETNVQNSTPLPQSDAFVHQGYLVLPDVQYHSTEKRPVAIVFAFFHVCNVNIFNCVINQNEF